jgi:hypothetical protein
MHKLTIPFNLLFTLYLLTYLASCQKAKKTTKEHQDADAAEIASSTTIITGTDTTTTTTTVDDTGSSTRQRQPKQQRRPGGGGSSKNDDTTATSDTITSTATATDTKAATDVNTSKNFRWMYEPGSTNPKPPYLPGFVNEQWKNTDRAYICPENSFLVGLSSLFLEYKNSGKKYHWGDRMWSVYCASIVDNLNRPVIKDSCVNAIKKVNPDYYEVKYSCPKNTFFAGHRASLDVGDTENWYGKGNKKYIENTESIRTPEFKCCRMKGYGASAQKLSFLKYNQKNKNPKYPRYIESPKIYKCSNELKWEFQESVINDLFLDQESLVIYKNDGSWNRSIYLSETSEVYIRSKNKWYSFISIKEQSEEEKKAATTDTNTIVETVPIKEKTSTTKGTLYAPEEIKAIGYISKAEEPCDTNNQNLYYLDISTAKLEKCSDKWTPDPNQPVFKEKDLFLDVAMDKLYNFVKGEEEKTPSWKKIKEKERDKPDFETPYYAIDKEPLYGKYVEVLPTSCTAEEENSHLMYNDTLKENTTRGDTKQYSDIDFICPSNSVLKEISYTIAPTGDYQHIHDDIILKKSPEDATINYTCADFGIQKSHTKFEYTIKEGQEKLKYYTLPYDLNEVKATTGG